MRKGEKEKNLYKSMAKKENFFNERGQTMHFKKFSIKVGLAPELCPRPRAMLIRNKFLFPKDILMYINKQLKLRLKKEKKGFNEGMWRFRSIHCAILL